MRSKLVATGLLAACLATSARAAVVDGVNADKNPDVGTSWAATEVGWHYTPAFSYNLTGVETRFDAVDGRTVTLEIYDEHPGSGGTLLASAGFNPSTSFAGGFFAPLALSAGEDYFIGFRNVGGLGVNVTTEAGAVSLGLLHYSFSNDGSYSIPEQGFTSQPILRMHDDNNGTPTVPVPGAAWLGLALMGGITALRRHRSIA